jgi:hypothetical protein
MKHLPASVLHELLAYDPENGIITWRNPGYRAAIKETAGTLNGVGGTLIMINQVQYLARKIVWCMMTGLWPALEVNHLDADNTNFKWSNLRLASRSENAVTRKRRKDNTSGHKGIYWCRQTQKWRVIISNNGQTEHLGRFEELDDAIRERTRRMTSLYGEFYDVARD